jgi:hypothetical protein
MLFGSGGAAAQAAEPAGDGLRFSGFGTVGVVNVDAPPGWGFLRSTEQGSSSRQTRADVDSRLGLQLNYAPNRQFELVGQMLAMRRRSDAATGDAIEWAFAAYRPTADLTIRAGRLNLDQYVMSDYRNVGFAYPYVRPPVEYYGSIPTNLDGVDVTQAWDTDDARWRVKGFFGRSKASGVRLKDLFGFSVARESDGLMLRAGWTRARLAYNVAGVQQLIDGLNQLQAVPVPSVVAEAAALRDDLDLAAKPATYATVGMSYEHGDWLMAAEATKVSLGNARATAEYASLGRRMGDVTLFGIVSGSQTSAALRPMPTWGATLAPLLGPVMAQQAQMLGVMATTTANRTTRQTTYSLGARWDIHPRMALKLQWDHTKIKPSGAFLWSEATNDPGSADVATVLLDFVF